MRVEFYASLSDNVGIVKISLVVLCGNELNVVRIDHRLLKGGSEISVDGVHDIAVGSVGVFSRGHYDEVSLSCVDDLNVVYCETVVEGYGYDRLHRAFVKEFSDFNVCDLHLFFLSSKC